MAVWLPLGRGLGLGLGLGYGLRAGLEDSRGSGCIGHGGDGPAMHMAGRSLAVLAWLGAGCALGLGLGLRLGLGLG